MTFCVFICNTTFFQIFSHLSVFCCNFFSPRCIECRAVYSTCNQEKAVCPSVRRPSVKRVDCDKTEESSVQIFIPY